MFETLDDLWQYGSLIMIVVSIIFIALSGVLFGFTYYTMGVVQTSFEANDCVIENNILVGSCQDLWGMSVYPFLNLKDILIWFSFFFIFSLVIGMLLFGYQSGKSPILMGLLIVFVMVITYLGIEMSNMYRTMLENDLLRSMMTEFTVYNQIMLNFPYFCFIIGLFAVMLSIVNYQRTKVNQTSSSDLTY